MAVEKLARPRRVGKVVRVYALAHPATGAVRYVGVTSRTLAHRLYHHCHAAQRRGRTHVERWVAGVLAEGAPPSILLLAEVPEGGDWQAAEREWIARRRAAGARLCNLTDGGDGGLGYKFSAEQCEARATRMRGRKLSKAHRAALSAAKQGERHNYYGKKRPAETCARIAAAKMGARNPMFGKTGAQHHNARPVIVLGARYPSIADAIRRTGVSKPTIHAWLKNGRAYYALE